MPFARELAKQQMRCKSEKNKILIMMTAFSIAVVCFVIKIFMIK